MNCRTIQCGVSNMWLTGIQKELNLAPGIATSAPTYYCHLHSPVCTPLLSLSFRSRSSEALCRGLINYQLSVISDHHEIIMIMIMIVTSMMIVIVIIIISISSSSI